MSNCVFLIKILFWFKLYWSLFPRVQFTIDLSLKLWLGSKQAANQYLNQWRLRSIMLYGITRPINVYVSNYTFVMYIWLYDSRAVTCPCPCILLNSGNDWNIGIPFSIKLLMIISISHQWEGMDLFGIVTGTLIKYLIYGLPSCK